MSTEEAVEEKLPNMAESRSSAEKRAQVHRFHALIVSFVLCRTQQLQPWRYIPPRDIATSAAAAEVKVHTMESSNSLMVHVQDTFSHIVHSPKKRTQSTHNSGWDSNLMSCESSPALSFFHFQTSLHRAHSALTFVRLRLLAANFWRFVFQLNFSWERFAACRALIDLVQAHDIV